MKASFGALMDCVFKVRAGSCVGYYDTLGVGAISFVLHVALVVDSYVSR